MVPAAQSVHAVAEIGGTLPTFFTFDRAARLERGDIPASWVHTTALLIGA